MVRRVGMGKNNSIRQTREDTIFDIVNYILLTFILIIVVYPLIFVISASFSSPAAVIRGEMVIIPVKFNLEAYIKVFENNEIMTGYKNTIIYTIVGTSINVLLTIMAAYPLSKRSFYGRNLLTALFTFTMFFSGGMIPTYLIVKQMNLLDNFWVMILPGAVSMWNIVIMRTFFQNSIPAEIEEAAFIDGCSNIKTLFYIVLPLSAPIIAVMILYYGVGHWNAFFNALLYLTNRKKFPLQFILREILIQNQMEDMIHSDTLTISEQESLAEIIKYAVIVVASAPMMILYPFLQKYFVKGVMIGAIKG
jgi:putative aldouronate transport system permease protein